MKWEFRQVTWENSIKTNYMLAAACVGLTVITLFSVYVTLTTHERIVVVPAGLKDRAAVSWNSADSTYLKSFGLFIATLIGNITPANVKFVSDSLSTYLAPDIYSEVRKKMLQLADSSDFADSASSTRFVPLDILYEPDTNKVFVSGQMIVASAITKQTQNLIYEMQIEVLNGQPIVQNVTSYDGLEFHTKKWLDLQKTLKGEK